MRNRTVLKLFGIIMPIITRIITFLLPGRRSRVLAQECKNKCTIMGLVQNLESYMDKEGKTPVETIVEKCYEKGAFPALWAVEGAGKDIAHFYLERDPNPKGIFTNTVLPEKWDKSLLMLHAGLGMATAISTMEPLLKGATDAQLETAVKRIIDLNRNNSRKGYFGAAMESLGLVTRFMFNDKFCLRVHKVVEAYDKDALGFYWRGLGRCCYFHPFNFIPGILRPCRAIKMAEDLAPNAHLRETMKAGMAWAMTIVNMSHPEVMEWILENHDDYFSGSPGFFNGVVSSVVMRYDTSPDLPLIQNFMNHKPDSRNRTLAGLWNSKIKGSLETAINFVYPVLKKHQRLDEVFRYQSLPALATRLEAGPPA